MHDDSDDKNGIPYALGTIKIISEPYQVANCIKKLLQ